MLDKWNRLAIGFLIICLLSIGTICFFEGILEKNHQVITNELNDTRTIIVPSQIPKALPLPTPIYGVLDPRMSQNMLTSYDGIQLNITNINHYLTETVLSITFNGLIVWSGNETVNPEQTITFNIVNGRADVTISVNYSVIWHDKPIPLYFTKVF